MNAVDDNRCLRFVGEVLKILKTTNQYERVLHLIVDKLARIYKCQTCAVVLINRKTEYLNIENSIGLSYTFSKSFKRQFATGAVGQLLWTGKPIVIPDGAAQPELAAEMELEHPFASCIAVQITADHRTLGYLYVDSTEREKFTEEDIPLVETFAGFAGVAIHKANLYEENLRLDRIDHETGLEKYGPFLERLRTAMERGEGFHEGFALLLLDVDNFKTVGQTYGYDSSKLFLKELADLVKSQLRRVDAVGRYGFDEFIILLPNSGIDEAIESAKKLARAAEDTTFTSHCFRSTVSMGVAAYPQNGKTLEELMLTAKNALFEAQRSGRNKIFHYLTEWYTADVLG